MNIIFFSHPDFLGHQSMPRFTQMLSEGMQNRGHIVEIWRPEAILHRIPAPRFIKKWLGYIDQYIIFYLKVSRRIKLYNKDTLFVFTDHALGPWVPLVANRLHVIHCHDFLAQYSALSMIPEHRTGWAGKKYQMLIHKGYSKGKNFISVSQKTRSDLSNFLPLPPVRSKLVYNGLNQKFAAHDPVKSRIALSNELKIKMDVGYILHVGGNQWYKNRRGVIEIYNAWRTIYKASLPLLLIGSSPDPILSQLYRNSPYSKDIYFLPGIDNEWLQFAYSGASAFLFPSLAEGFGWPIAEAMAAGCPVITTAEPPMTEVAGDAAFLISKRPYDDKQVASWARESAMVVNEVVELNETSRDHIVQRGIKNALRFNTEDSLTSIEAVYKDIVTNG